MARDGGNTNNPYYGYIQKLQNYFVDNPEGFWADNEKASAVRQWLYKNAPRFMEYAYDNTPDYIRSAIPNKFLSSELRSRRMKSAVSSDMNTFGKTYMPIISTFPMLAEGLVSAPLATAGGILGSIAGDYGGRELDEHLGYENPTFQIVGGLAGGLVGGAGGNKITNTVRRYRDGNAALSINDDSFYRRFLDKKQYDDAINSGVIRNSKRGPVTHWKRGQILGRPRKNEVVVKSSPDNGVTFGRIGHSSQPPDIYNYDPIIKVAEDGTPVLNISQGLAKIEPVPYTPRSDNFTFYRKLPEYRIPFTNKYIDFGYEKLNPTFNNSYGNLRFYRNISNIPAVDNGLVSLTKDNGVIHNFTTDLPFRPHSSYSYTYPHVLATSAENLAGNVPIVGDPMDTFFLKSSAIKAPANKSIFISGDKNALRIAKERGLKTLTSDKLQEEFGKIESLLQHSPDEMKLFDFAVPYRQELDNLITTKLGRPSFRDYQFFSGTTRTPLTVERNTGQFRDYMKLMKGKSPDTKSETIKTSYPVFDEKSGLFKHFKKRNKERTALLDYKYIYDDPFAHVYYDLTPESESVLVNDLRFKDLSYMNESELSGILNKYIGNIKKPIKSLGGQLSLYDGGGKIQKPRVKTDNTKKSFLENTYNYFTGAKLGLIPSSYRPTIGDKGETYYTRKGLVEDVILNLFGGVDSSQRGRSGSRVFYRNFDEAHNNISRIGNDRRQAGNATLGNYTVSAGKDDRGRYISFYDIYDYKLLPLIYPFLHPYHIYDRIYEDEVENIYDKIKHGSPYNSELCLLQPTYKAGDTVLYEKGGKIKKIEKYQDPYKEKLFRNWYDQYAIGNGLVDDLGNVTDPDDKEHYYDYRRYWEDNIFKNPIDAGFIVPYTHLPDTYKMPGHPTMSIESMYHPKNKPGMVWEERQGPYENKEVYRPETEAEYMRRYISPRRDVPYDTDFTLDALDKMVKSYPKNNLTPEDVQYLYDQLMYRSNVDPRVAAYALYTESKFDPKAANKGSSARGISQLIGSAIQDLYPKNYESIQKQYLNGERPFKDQVDDFLNYINKNSGKINGQFNNYGMVKKMMLAPNKSLNAVIDMSTYRKSFTDKQYANLMARSKRPKFRDVVDMYNEEYDKYMNSLTSELEKEQQEILQKKREDQIKAMANVIVGSGKEKIVKDFIDRINAQKQSNPNKIYNRAYQELPPFNNIRHE